MTDLSQLIERVESATEGSRELDADVYEAFGNEVIRHPKHINGRAWKYRPGYGPWPAMERFTTSLDAVMSLMPEGYAVTNMMIWPGERASLRLLGTMLRPFGKDHRMSWVHAAGDGRWDGDGATAPLALLAAILKARQTAAQPAKQSEARSSEQSGVRHD